MTQSNSRYRCFRRAMTLVPLLLAFLLPFYAGVTTSEARHSFPNLPSPLAGGQGGGIPEAKVQIQETYGKLPLYFIRNDGQVDEKVKFYEKGSGHATYFTKEGVYIQVVRGERSDDRSKKLENTSPAVPSPLAGGRVGGNPNSSNSHSSTPIPILISSPWTSRKAKSTTSLAMIPRNGKPTSRPTRQSSTENYIQALTSSSTATTARWSMTSS